MKWARLVPGACATGSKDVYNKMQHTMITLKGKERRVDIECLALETLLRVLRTHCAVRHGNTILQNETG